MHPSYYPEPPTQATIFQARKELITQEESVKEITRQIEEKEAALARIVEDSKRAILTLEKERETLQAEVTYTLAYISPIKRLPQELLRDIFLFNFEEYPCCAWVLAAVCSLWRRLALSMPKLWSKIRLVTTQDASADTIRLWLERSGPSISLDIEVFLHSPPVPRPVRQPRRRRHSSTGTILVDGWDQDGWGTPSNWAVPPASLPVITGHGVHGTATYVHGGHAGGHGQFQANNAEDGVPPLATSERTAGQNSRSRISMHWGHIVFFYLVEQMRRWERFVFRFDKTFASLSSLGAIVGDAPLLREFEISSAEAGIFSDWGWLPSAKANTTYDLQRMESLTLQYVPFKWYSPILKNLRSLSLRTLPISHIALDRILGILSSSPNLEELCLYFSSATPAVLPLVPLTLPQLRVFSIGGHYLMSTIVESLILPSLESFTFDVDARDASEDTISALVARSNNPPLSHLSIAYGSNGITTPTIYYAGAVIGSWNFLGELDHLCSLYVGGTPFEHFVTMLSASEDDIQPQDKWLCPNLVSLAMRSCHTHSDGVAKLVQMVDSRNPDAAAGITPFSIGGIVPMRLKRLEIHDCATLGLDVVEWLKTRVDDVVCTEPNMERSPRSPSFHYV